MDRTFTYMIYLLLTMSWSGITFTVLLPDVKNILYSKCVWKFNFIFCNKFFGIEGAYRFTLSIVLFYVLLSLVTIRFHGNDLVWYCQDSCFLKLVFFILTVIVGFLIPFSRQTMEILYNIFMFSSLVFFVVVFILIIDSAHAFRMLWLRHAKNNLDTPTCYLCTWLFMTHFITAFLYAISLDLILAFFFFNTIEDCLNTLIFLTINVCLCLLCFSVSYFPSLRDREASSQIVFASVLFYVVFITWLALSDPENEYCNMYGTIFTGSILESSTSFRSIVLLVVAFPALLFLCLKKNTGSYMRSLLTDNEYSGLACLDYPKFHLIMAGASSFVLMAVTNFYEPVFSVLQTFGTEKRTLKTSVIYFEGLNSTRFIAICILSSFLPIFYFALLLFRVGKTFFIQWREQKNAQKGRAATNADGSSVFCEKSNNQIEFLYVKLCKEEASRRLTGLIIPKSDAVTLPTCNVQYLLLQCFYVSEIDLAFWHFPKHISQTYFNGRNGSNACTVISMIIGRFFSRSDLVYQNTGYLVNEWLNLFYTSIEDGNLLYDTLVKEMGVLDLSIEEVHDRLGSNLNVEAILPSLAVSFESDVETVTVFYQLKQLVLLRRKLVVLFIHKKRTSSFLIYGDGNIVYVDSHAFGENGALMISAKEETLMSLLNFLKEILGNAGNRLATLTVLEYERRKLNISNP